MAVEPLESRWRIACHEADHAVAAARMEVPFSEVRLDEGYEGFQVSQPNPRNLDQLRKLQLIAAAGAAAEELLWSGPSQGSGGDQDDHAKYEEDETIPHPDRGGQGWLDDVEEVRGVLDCQAIRTVATALLASKYLDEKGVCSLIGLVPWYER